MTTDSQDIDAANDSTRGRRSTGATARGPSVRVPCATHHAGLRGVIHETSRAHLGTLARPKRPEGQRVVLPALKTGVSCNEVENRMRRAAVLLACGVLVASVAGAGDWRAIDGDTIERRCDGIPVRMRLYGIDAPELRQPYGAEAKTCLQTQLDAMQHWEVWHHTRDAYGRAVVSLSGMRRSAKDVSIVPDIAEDLVRGGCAWWSGDFAPDATTLQQAQTQAQSAKIGLWALPEPPIAPWLWRKGKRTP